jgi:hypothetical protein
LAVHFDSTSKGVVLDLSFRVKRLDPQRSLTIAAPIG